VLQFGRLQPEFLLVPEEFRAESLAAALGADAKGKRFLLIRASRGREVLAEQLVMPTYIEQTEQPQQNIETPDEAPPTENSAFIVGENGELIVNDDETPEEES